MIRMISGVTRLGKRLITPKDGCFAAPPEAENRLVLLGVAVFAEESPLKAVATPLGEANGRQTGENLPEEENAAQGEETAHLDPEQLRTLTNGKLRELAEEMGIETGSLRTKAQLIEAITAEDVSAGADDEPPPTLAAEAPVV